MTSTRSASPSGSLVSRGLRYPVNDEGGDASSSVVHFALLFARVNYIANVGNCERRFGHIGGDDTQSAAIGRPLKHSLLLVTWQQRIQRQHVQRRVLIQSRLVDVVMPQVIFRRSFFIQIHVFSILQRFRLEIFKFETLWLAWSGAINIF